jgi:hypothetical protein
MAEGASANFAPMTATPNICAFCHRRDPVTHDNGVVVTYEYKGKSPARVLLHKGCAAEWSKRFEHSVPIQIRPLADRE